jgi:hypothetical protein
MRAPFLTVIATHLNFQPSAIVHTGLSKGNNQIGRFSYCHFDHALVLLPTSGSPAQLLAAVNLRSCSGHF